MLSAYMKVLSRCYSVSQLYHNSRFDYFQSQISALDEQTIQNISSALRPFLNIPNESPVSIGLFGRGQGLDFLKLTNYLIENEDKSKEFLIHPVWSQPTDWNQYFTLAKSKYFTSSKVFWAARSASSWFNVFPEHTLDISLAHVPDFLSRYTSKQDFFLVDSEKLSLQDFESFLMLRIKELKTGGKLALIIDLEHEASLRQLLVRTGDILENMKNVSFSEKEKIGFNMIGRNEEEIDQVLKKFEGKAKVLYKASVNEDFYSARSSKETIESHAEILTAWVKEKIGKDIFFSLDPNRKFEEKQEIMIELLSNVNKNFQQDPPKSSQKSNILVLEAS